MERNDWLSYRIPAASALALMPLSLSVYPADCDPHPSSHRVLKSLPISARADSSVWPVFVILCRFDSYGEKLTPRLPPNLVPAIGWRACIYTSPKAPLGLVLLRSIPDIIVPRSLATLSLYNTVDKGQFDDHDRILSTAKLFPVRPGRFTVQFVLCDTRGH